MTSLYLLANEYQEAALKLADMELDEQTIADTLEGMAGDIQTKATNVAMFVRNTEATAAAIDEAIKAMSARKKALEHRADKLRDYLLTNMEKCAISKIECPYFALTIKKNPPSVVIDAAGLIPGELYIYPEAPEPFPDKKAIAAKLKAGEEVSGAHLETKTRLEIK